MTEKKKAFVCFEKAGGPVEPGRGAENPATGPLAQFSEVLKGFEERMLARQAEWDRLPKCPACGEPVWGGRCVACEVRAEERAKTEAIAKARDIKRLGGLKAYERFTLSNYGNQAAIDKCAGYPDINLYLWGAAGVGKSHLAVAAVRIYEDGLVLKPQQILRKLRGLKTGAEEEAVIERVASKRHLVIDDLGVEKTTAYSLSSLYEIIEMRDMNYAKGLIVTSNLSLGALAERLGDDRIASRLAGMCRVVEITGNDRRLEK